MANKRPAEQWYTGDWYRAVDVQKCCPATRGIWRDAIDAMVNEQVTGKIRGTREAICRLLRCSDKELQRFFDDNKEHKFANVTFRYGKVTIVCRRLYRVYLERERARKGMKRHRAERRYADVTLLSSSSSSSSNNTYTLQQVLDIAPLVGVDEKKAEEFFHHYKAQGWVFGNGQPVDDLSSALHRWKRNGYRFERQTVKTSAGQRQSAGRTERAKKDRGFDAPPEDAIEI